MSRDLKFRFFFNFSNFVTKFNSNDVIKEFKKIKKIQTTFKRKHKYFFIVHSITFYIIFFTREKINYLKLTLRVSFGLLTGSAVGICVVVTFIFPAECIPPVTIFSFIFSKKYFLFNFIILGMNN